MSPLHEVAYLAGGSAYVAAGLDVLAKTKSRDKVFLRAYSFDAPSVLTIGGTRRSLRTGSSVLLNCGRFAVLEDEAPMAVA